MPTTWVVVADEGHARFLARDDAQAELAQIDEFTDAGAHARNAGLRRDAYGRRGSTVTESAGEDGLAHEAEAFARRVAAHLAEAHRRGHFDELRIAAAPKFLGRLRQQLAPEVGRCVSASLDKDYVGLDARELTRRLFAG